MLLTHVPAPFTQRQIASKSRSCLLLGAACLLAVLGNTKLARAEPSASDRATARALAGEGYAALKQKDYQTAEDRFHRADELVHAPTLVVDHARALVGLGRLGEAYVAYRSVLDEPLPAKVPDVWRRAVKDAQKELQALEPRVAFLTINVRGASEPEVTIDGHPLPATLLGQRHAETPGEREVVVRAHGFVDKQAKVVLKEGNDASLDLELLPEPKPEPVVVLPPPAPTPRAEPELPPERSRTLAYASFGVAGVGLATGAVAGILWLNARSDIKAACGGLSCEAASDNEGDRLRSDKRRHDTFGTLSGVGFAVGVAGAATGAALLIFEPNPEVRAQTAAVRITPYCGPASLGLRGTFQ